MSTKLRFYEMFERHLTRAGDISLFLSLRTPALLFLASLASHVV
jgi:hypothetical protein